MPAEATIEQTILKECPRMSRDDCFTFRCSPELDCFTHCCRDVNIILTPYDVIRLKHALGIDSSELLERYTLAPRAGGQKFPMVILEMDGENKACPFLGEQGCGVYQHRPWACRMYPLGVAEPKNPTPNDNTFHFVLHEDLCHGHGEGLEISVRNWLANQGIDEYEAMGAAFRDLTLHDFWDSDKELTHAQWDMFYMACYDLDRFRRFIFETRFLEMFEVDEARVEAIRNDDDDLLEFAMQWLRFSIFHERSMRMRRAEK